MRVDEAVAEAHEEPNEGPDPPSQPASHGPADERPTPLCPTIAEPVMTHNGHRYAIMATAVSWASIDAQFKQRSCCGVAGHLATISDASEKGFVSSLLSATSASVWLGFSDKASEGVLTWTTGETFDPALVTITGGGNTDPYDYGYAYISSGALNFGLITESTFMQGLIEFDCSTG